MTCLFFLLLGSGVLLLLAHLGIPALICVVLALWILEIDLNSRNPWER